MINYRVIIANIKIIGPRSYQMWLAQSDLQVLKGEICQPDPPQTLEADLGHLALDFWICLGRFQCQGLQYKAVLLELEITN